MPSRPSPRFPRDLLCGLAALACPLLRAQEEPPAAIAIRVDPATVVGHIAPGFLGFGYEASAVAQPGYFSAADTTLVNLYRNLDAHGLVRIGGNVSDHTRYVPDGTPAVAKDDGVSIINRAGLTELGAFLRATGWEAMWGLNLGTGTRQEAADEAQAVAELLAGHLQSFEIGNEVDLHHGYAPDLKTYDQYHAAYLDYRTAIRAVLPQAAFSGPDSASNLDYLERFAATEARDLRLLTIHYYRGSAGAKTSTMARLLARDDGWAQRLAKLQRLSEDSHVPFRINEINSFSGGGKAGVSDTFASALWCLDYCYIAASYGCGGVNMQTDINHRAFISHYSPIVHDDTGRCSARPEYYGMLAFAMAGHGALLKVAVDQAGIDMAAYATDDGQGSLWLTVIGKDLARDAQLAIVVPGASGEAEAFRLSAPGAESTDHTSFAGKEVSPDGGWAPGAPERLPVAAGAIACGLPHASAVVIRVRR